MKICRKCGIEKPLKEFYNQTNTKDGKTVYCKECMDGYKKSILGRAAQKKYLKKYYNTHKEGFIAKQKLLRNSNKVRYNLYQRKYDKSDKGKLTDKKYKSGEHGKFASIKCTHKRRVLSKDVENILTLEQWNKILFLQKNKCQICRKIFTKTNPPTQDHIIPLSKNGSLTFENVQALCGKCNSKKKDIIDKNNIVTWISILG